MQDADFRFKFVWFSPCSGVRRFIVPASSSSVKPPNLKAVSRLIFTACSLQHPLNHNVNVCNVATMCMKMQPLDYFESETLIYDSQEASVISFKSKATEMNRTVAVGPGG